MPIRSNSIWRLSGNGLNCARQTTAPMYFIQTLFPHVYQITLGIENVFLLTEDEPVLIDAGYAHRTETILKAMRRCGVAPQDLKHLIVTHWHPDHAGSVAALRERTHATVYMHPADAAVANRETPPPPFVISPDLRSRLSFAAFVRKVEADFPPFQPDVLLAEGMTLPFGGGLQVWETFGHSMGQVALLHQKTGLLIAGDVCMNLPYLTYSVGHDDLAMAQQTLRRLADAGLEAMCFGHGLAIRRKASERLQRAFFKD